MEEYALVDVISGWHRANIKCVCSTHYLYIGLYSVHVYGANVWVPHNLSMFLKCFAEGYQLELHAPRINSCISTSFSCFYHPFSICLVLFAITWATFSFLFFPSRTLYHFCVTNLSQQNWTSFVSTNALEKKMNWTAVLAFANVIDLVNSLHLH